ncbi:hypothetical protein Tco_0646995 [Tanacetum coccineum]
MTTLAEFMIIAGADNRPLILEKSMYESWKSHMVLYMENKENGRMILDSVQNGPLKLQADYDLKATNIVLQGLPPDVYAIVNHHKISKEIWDRVKLLMQGTKLSLQERECLVVPVFSQRDDPIACLNKVMAFLPLFKTTGLLCNKFKGGKDKVMLVLAIRVMLLVPGEIMQEGRQGLLNVIIIKVKDTWLGNSLSLRGQGTLHDPGIPDSQAAHTTIPNNASFQTEDLDAYDSDCDDVSTTQAVLMANLSNYGSDDFKQTPVVDFPDNEITSDSNIIPYFQYLQETQQAAVQDTNFVISSQHAIIPIIDDEETLILDEAPRELPKVSLVNTRLKKLKYHLGKFDTVVKKRITPDAIIEGEWGFEYTKAVFINEIIPFLKTLKDIFNVFDKDLLNEVTKAQTVFNQMKAVVQQCSVDK